MSNIFNRIKYCLVIYLIISIHANSVFEKVSYSSYKDTLSNRSDQNILTFLGDIPENEEENSQQNPNLIMSRKSVAKTVGKCLFYIESEISPAFCWRKTVPEPKDPICPEKMVLSMDVCREPCKTNYEYYETLCIEACREGYKHIGKYCEKNGLIELKLSYTPATIKISDEKVQCPFSLFKTSEGKCIEKCESFNMVKCGPKACASDPGTCKTQIFNFVLDTLWFISQLVVFIATEGLSSSITCAQETLSTGLTQLKDTALQLSFDKVKEALAEQVTVDKILKYLETDLLTGAVKAAEVTAAVQLCEEIIGKINESADEITEKAAMSAIKSLDVLGIGDIAKDCSSEADFTCFKDVVSAVKAFDPTGILSVLHSFMYADCPSTLQRAIPAINDVKAGCVRLYTQCFFTGESMEVCEDTEILKFATQSIKTSAQVNTLLFIESLFKGTSFNMQRSTEIECLGSKFNTNIHSIFLRANDCAVISKTHKKIIGHNHIDYDFICTNDPNYTLDYKDYDQIKLLIYNDDLLLTAYEKEGYQGEYVYQTHSRIFDKKSDLLKLIKSVKLGKQNDDERIGKMSDECVELYEYCDYGGRKATICNDSDVNFLDRINSVKIGSKAKPIFFTGNKYQGDLFILSEDAHCLQRENSAMTRIIGSIKLNGDKCFVFMHKRLETRENTVLCEGDERLDNFHWEWISSQDNPTTAMGMYIFNYQMIVKAFNEKNTKGKIVMDLNRSKGIKEDAGFVINSFMIIIDDSIENPDDEAPYIDHDYDDIHTGG